MSSRQRILTLGNKSRILASQANFRGLFFFLVPPLFLLCGLSVELLLNATTDGRRLPGCSDGFFQYVFFVNKLPWFAVALTKFFELGSVDGVRPGFGMYQTVLDMVVSQSLPQDLGSGLQLIHRVLDVSALQFDQIGVGFILIQWKKPMELSKDLFVTATESSNFSVSALPCS